MLYMQCCREDAELGLHGSIFSHSNTTRSDLFGGALDDDDDDDIDDHDDHDDHDDDDAATTTTTTTTLQILREHYGPNNPWHQEELCVDFLVSKCVGVS